MLEWLLIIVIMVRVTIIRDDGAESEREAQPSSSFSYSLMSHNNKILSCLLCLSPPQPLVLETFIHQNISLFQSNSQTSSFTIKTTHTIPSFSSAFFIVLTFYKHEL